MLVECQYMAIKDSILADSFIKNNNVYDHKSYLKHM